MAGWLRAFACLWYHCGLTSGQVGGQVLSLPVFESTSRGRGHCSREM